MNAFLVEVFIGNGNSSFPFFTWEWEWITCDLGKEIGIVSCYAEIRDWEWENVTKLTYRTAKTQSSCDKQK